MGEGACVLVLEEASSARARGARVYAEVSGYATNNDAYHMAAPRPDGSQAAACIAAAVESAGLSAADVDHVNAHGSSTTLNDTTETAAIRSALGARANAVTVTGTKPYHGHALGASGAIEIGIACLSIRDGWVPPTLNLDEPGDGCDLDYVTGSGREQVIRALLSNSFGFGGINAVVCLSAR
jgi:3-oxoacyl-[acyl-carrier-protein] synthase II